jgi:hypothetical protein
MNRDAVPMGVPPVRWVDDVPGSSLAPGTSASSNTGASVASAPGLAPAPANPAAPAAQNPGPGAVARAQPIDRKALTNEVRQMIRESKDPALTRALSALALNIADPSIPIDPADLSGLDTEKRLLITNYQRLLASPGAVGAPGTPGTPGAPGPADPQMVKVKPDPAAAPGATPGGGGLSASAVTPGDADPGALKIRTALLCRRVRGYGAYDAFESNTFLAGRDQKVIVYVELDQFRSAKNVQGMFQVKLSQDVRLYNQADGLKVWAQPPVDIIDESHNERRDFFVVQLVQLPAQLGVGKYVLKVRVQDRQANTVDEATVPLNIVADRTLLSDGPTASR